MRGVKKALELLLNPLPDQDWFSIVGHEFDVVARPSRHLFDGIRSILTAALKKSVIRFQEESIVVNLACRRRGASRPTHFP